MEKLRGILALRPAVKEVLSHRVAELANPIAFAITFDASEEVVLIECIDIDDSIRVSVVDDSSLAGDFVRDDSVTSAMAGSFLTGFVWTVNLQGYTDGVVIFITSEAQNVYGCQFEAAASMVEHHQWQLLDK